MKRTTKKLTYEEQHIRNLERLQQLRPIDDIFMRELFRDNKPLIQLVLRIITGITDLTVISAEIQHDMDLYGSRGVCFDVYATDSNDRRFNIEVQRSDEGAKPKRARYHSSVMDVDALDKSQDFEELPVTYVIFITENDVHKKNKPLYVYERREITDNSPLGDDEYIIYVNGAYNNPEDNSDLAKLIHDFNCNKADDMYHELMARRTEYYKEKLKGTLSMCRILEDMVNEAKTEATEEATEEAQIKFALNLLNLGKLSKEDIATATGLDIEDIEELATEHNPVQV